MAQPYQLIYRLEDFRNSERYTTSTVNGGTLNIYKNIVPQVGKGNFSKLGIQAPAGTQFYINDTSSPIMMGRTGIYELDEDVNVSLLQFKAPVNYVLDEAATQQALENGINQTSDAEEFYTKYITIIGDKTQCPDNIDVAEQKTTSYWKDYNTVVNGGTLSNGMNIPKGYTEQMEGAQALLIRGINGIYSENGVKEIDNVIIDFLYEGGGSN